MADIEKLTKFTANSRVTAACVKETAMPLHGLRIIRLFHTFHTRYVCGFLRRSRNQKLHFSGEIKFIH